MSDIQRLLDNTTAPFIALPAGEYEGNFKITKPCRIIGKHTTLWANQGTVLQISSSVVTVEHIRIEGKQKAVATNQKDTRFLGVEVSGMVEGVAGENGFWRLPQLFSLGTLAANKEHTAFLEVEVPVACHVHCTIDGVTITPEEIQPGKHRLTLHIAPLAKDTCIYGDILLESTFFRRIYVTGTVLEGAEQCVVEEVPKEEYITKPPITWDRQAMVLQKGQRVSLGEIEKEMLTIVWEAEGYYSTMEIDPYVFLLNGAEKVNQEEDMLFFGQEHTQNGAVSVKGAEVQLQLSKVLPEVERISIAYGIYEEHTKHTLEAVKQMTIKLMIGGKEKMVFPLEGLTVETTVIAIEFYRYRGVWKVSAIGAGYAQGIKQLCMTYGVEVAEE